MRGSILDRNGNTIAFSQKPGGARTYSHPYAFSNLVGYWSKIYGTYGVEKTMNEELVHSNCGANPKQKKGADVSLTIDAALQERAYKDIEKYKGSVAVLDAKTGEILALASSPSFNVSEIEDKWKKINEKEGVFLSNAYQNPVAPGSVFKLITSKEIVEAGIEREEVEDTGSITVNGQTIRNYGGKAYGSISFREGFVKSSNVYFMNRALKLGGLRLYKTGKSFLLGEDISLDFATIHSNFDLKGYEDNVVATTAFGQGETLVTPLQMAMVTQSIANDGVMLKPYLFKSVVNGKGQTTAEGKSEKLVETMDTDTAQEIKEAMKAAAQSYGMSTVGEKEYSIAAKTGTAERGDGEGVSPGTFPAGNIPTRWFGTGSASVGSGRDTGSCFPKIARPLPRTFPTGGTTRLRMRLCTLRHSLRAFSPGAGTRRPRGPSAMKISSFARPSPTSVPMRHSPSRAIFPNSGRGRSPFLWTTRRFHTGDSRCASTVRSSINT